MSSPLFEALESVYPQIIDQMDNEFDSHQFILILAHQNQRLYVEALAAYAKTNRPFQIVHGEIANRLNNQHAVEKIGERNSEDIFGQVNSSSLWRKIQG